MLPPKKVSPPKIKDLIRAACWSYCLVFPSSHIASSHLRFCAGWGITGSSAKSDYKHLDASTVTYVTSFFPLPKQIHAWKEEAWLCSRAEPPLTAANVACQATETRRLRCHSFTLSLSGSRRRYQSVGWYFALELPCADTTSEPRQMWMNDLSQSWSSAEMQRKQVWTLTECGVSILEKNDKDASFGPLVKKWATLQ